MMPISRLTGDDHLIPTCRTTWVIFVDLYVPRKCSASNRIISAKDHASIQINIAELDPITGRFGGQFKTYAICGAFREDGTSEEFVIIRRNGINFKHCILCEVFLFCILFYYLHHRR
uniref:Small ribosomal subunit protein eS21 n=1 Tax=Eptatretus burgeri TaxID=7764 RepID=A0A8C4N6G6_EPTBU